MQQFLDTVSNVNGVVNNAVWGLPGLILLIGTGILLTLGTKVFQISHVGHWWKMTIASIFKKGSKTVKNNDKKTISQFQALCAALAATVGTGNIAGVAAAIVTGGPGAVFWMWIAAFFGMMTNFSENLLGIYYRRRNKDGEWSGGPMYYLRDGLGKRYSVKWLSPVSKVLAVLFSCFAILASFGIGNMAQINKIVLNMDAAFFKNTSIGTLPNTDIPVVHLILGIALLIIAALIIIGGLKRIARFAEVVVPFMAVVYVIGSLIIFAMNFDQVGTMFAAIFKFAFRPAAFIGGGIGMLIKKTMTQGFKRGVFSNEAGLGSSVMVHSSSNVKEPVKQGMWGIFEVFFDTFVVCTMTAIVVLSTGYINLATGEPVAGANGDTLVSEAFGTYFGSLGTGFVAIAMLFFAFTTVLGWSQYGSKAVEYLFGTTGVKIYKFIFVAMIVSGAVMEGGLAWDLSDTFNGLMMIPNLVGVLALFPLVLKITKNYVDRKIRGKDVSPLLSNDPDIQAEMERTLSEE
ncbi:MAG: alanine:cation symporter family protein [Ruminococcaceae bacterium]|nr:alanine:cation symporter family protein [Oscillospiraceae bacterium]